MSDLLSVNEAAKLLKIGPAALRKRIRTRTMKAIKIGRSYIISRDEVLRALGELIGEESKKEIDKAVKKAFEEYTEAFKKLGKE